MQDQAFTILEYNQLRQLVKREAQTRMGQRRVDSITPLADEGKLRNLLATVSECVALRRRGVIWAFGELSDPDDSFTRLRVEGALLAPTGILDLANICDQAMLARAAVMAEREVAPHLWDIVKELPKDLNSLVARINSKILPTGELDDRASPELARIRHEITRSRSSITRVLENLMRSTSDAIQDELVTLRNDRFVIPVKSDQRARVKGVAHGFSSSGATVFVEPMATIDGNNELQSLREAEEREVTRILYDLTEELRTQLPALELAASAVGELDFINAKARFHQRFDCVIPEIESTSLSMGKLEFVKARHPLLEENLRSSGKIVVPVSFSLDENNSTMIISGANAGGKTVVLKTAGLLSLMAVSGLPVPAQSARVPLYRSVLADIGDHQSLAANLSTFTSHVANISRMIKMCETPALVLLDEVGTGTDPEEGSALGVAVVDHFRQSGAHVVATTHYSGLKMYAANEQGVLNASVEFDDRTLQPTYRLIVGVAGASSGLEIARRFGIPDHVIDGASGRVAESSREAATYLNRIKNDSDQIAALRRALEEERSAVAEKFASLEKTAAKHEAERQKTFEKALRETVSEFEVRARELVAQIENRAEQLKLERETQKRVADLRREAARARDRDLVPTTETSKTSRTITVMRNGKAIETVNAGLDAKHYVPSAKRDIAVGDKVRLRSFGSVGVVDQLKGDTADVRVKSLRFREKLSNLELVEEVLPKSAPGLAKARPTSGTEVHLRGSDQSRVELNVIGKRSDEAVDAVDKFLDEAALNQMTQVRIVHGHGTGALRRAIGELLQGHPHVEGFSEAPANQGGAGATVVELRQ